jgi:hypothetical protein
MAITLSTSRQTIPNRGGATFAAPAAIQVDDAPSGTSAYTVNNPGPEMFFVRLNDGTLTTDWAPVEPGQDAFLLLTTADPISMEFARNQATTPRFISLNAPTSRAITSTQPIIADIRPDLSAVGSGTTSSGCCSTLSTDFEITSSTAGIILRSPNGKRWRLSALNTGAIDTNVV